MKPLSSLLIALTLSGCAAIPPDGSSKLAMQPTQLGLQNAVIDWPSVDWWATYQDPQLDRLVADVLAKNPSLDAAQARLAMAQSATRGARAVQLPQINAGYQMTRERYSQNSLYPEPYGGSMQTDSSLRLNVGLDLDLWGKNRSRFAAATSQEHAAQADMQVARNALASAAVQSYFSLQSSLAQEAVISQITSQLENVVDITRERVTAGLDTQVEVNQALSALASAKVQLSQARTNSGLIRNQLSALLATSPERAARIAPVAFGPRTPDVPAQLPLDLLGRRADIVAAKHRISSSSSEISAAKADFFPNINLSAFAGFASLGVAKLLSSDSQVYGVGPALTLPLFHGGALNAQLAGKRAHRDLAIADYNQTLLDAVREVADACTSLRGLQQQATQQAHSLEAISAAYDIAVQRYKAGLGNFLQVLLAQNEVQKQSLLATDMKARAYQLDARLATALGGGYQEPKSTDTL